MSKPAIICVDDEPSVLESLKTELTQALGDTCLIETAESGEAALELFEELQSDEYEIALMLVDQIMPGLGGDELLKQIHQLSPQTLNIMIAGETDLETLSDEIESAKLYGYIAKPWHSEDLRATVLGAFQSYRYTRELEIQNVTLQQTVQQLEQSINTLKQSQQQLHNQCQQHESLSRLFLAMVSQQAQHYQGVQAQVKELAELNQRKDDFLEAVSHELRAPISNIRMATQMLEVRLQQLSDDDTVVQCERYFQILKTECQRETDLINDLLALIHLDSGADSLNLSTVSLDLWIPHIAESFTERIQEKEQNLRIELPATLPTFTTDLSHLERTLTELLNNACKYTPVGETITIAIQAVPSAQRIEPSEIADSPLTAPQVFTSSDLDTTLPSELWISINSSGVEIPLEEHEQIFQQFYRINSSNVGHPSSLGLAIVKKRVEKLRGTISLTTQPGETTFTIKLPLHLSA